MDGAEFEGTCLIQSRGIGTGVGGQCLLKSLLSENKRRVGWKHTHSSPHGGRSDVLKI